MAEERVQRRLAAILAADVAGYSRLMGVDEEGTLSALKELRRELADPKIKEHRGRIVKTTGDGLLVEFASAVDAVWTEFDLHRNFPADFVAQWDLFQVSSQVESKSQFLLRPDLGRNLSDTAKTLIRQRCPKEPDLQIVIGDGLSGAALSSQVPALFPLLQQHARPHGWSIGQSFAVRYCRVGIMNAIGDLLSPRVLVLLIGERPGLATAESLSAYMAYSPRPGHTDADRNLISNIHARGVRIEDAANRILSMAARMMAWTCIS